jgi:hypothetical protein
LEELRTVGDETMNRNYPLRSNNNRFWLISLFITLLTIACGVLELRMEDPQTNGAVTAPENQTQPSEPSSGQQNNQPNTQPNNKPATTLNPTGPWLIFITGNSNYDTQIWAANPDGSAMTVLADNVFIGGIHEDYLLPQISPNGHYLAYIEIEEQPVRAYLHIVDLPSGSDKRTVQLYDESQIGYSKEILDVILYQASSLAWSPDGQTLAFIGAIEGGTADLYVHVPDEESVARVSDGPGQAYMPAKPFCTRPPVYSTRVKDIHPTCSLRMACGPIRLKRARWFPCPGLLGLSQNLSDILPGTKTSSSLPSGIDPHAKTTTAAGWMLSVEKKARFPFL